MALSLEIGEQCLQAEVYHPTNVHVIHLCTYASPILQDKSVIEAMYISCTCVRARRHFYKSSLPSKLQISCTYVRTHRQSYKTSLSSKQYYFVSWTYGCTIANSTKRVAGLVCLSFGVPCKHREIAPKTLRPTLNTCSTTHFGEAPTTCACANFEVSIVSVMTLSYLSPR